MLAKNAKLWDVIQFGDVTYVVIGRTDSKLRLTTLEGEYVGSISEFLRLDAEIEKIDEMVRKDFVTCGH